MPKDRKKDFDAEVTGPREQDTLGTGRPSTESDIRDGGRRARSGAKGAGEEKERHLRAFKWQTGNRGTTTERVN